MDILFKLDRECSRKDASFAALYVEALTDYFVWQSAPKGYVTPELGKYLIENVAGDGHVARKTELELVLNVVHWARSCPDDVVSLVLDAVRQSVLLSRDTPYGANRPRAAIGAGDVAVLRKALHAPAGDGSLLATRREAEILFQLNEATGAGENDPAWRDFFVRALANHLLNKRARKARRHYRGRVFFDDYWFATQARRLARLRVAAHHRLSRYLLTAGRESGRDKVICCTQASLAAI